MDRSLEGSKSRRWLDLGVALLLLALGWAWLLGQNTRVLQRQADHAVERWVPDAVSVPLPRLLPMQQLLPLCRDGAPLLARYWPGALSERLGACLHDPAALDDTQGAALLAAWADDLQSRIDTAHRWADAYDAESAQLRQQMVSQLHALQGGSAPAAKANPGSEQPEDISGKDILKAPRQGEAGRVMRKQADSTQVWLNNLLKATARPATERARDVGLMIAGKQVHQDFGVSPPRAYLATDTRSLAESLEWQRRSQDHVAAGMGLGNHARLMLGVLVSSVVLLLAAAWLGLAVWPWALVSFFLGLGCLLLVDLGLSADAAFRALAFRQWDGLAVPGTDWRIWWPPLLLAVLLVLLRQITQSKRLDDWVRDYKGIFSKDWAQAGVLLLLGTAVLVVPGFSAAKSEVLMALGCLGLATFVARETALANIGVSFWPPGALRKGLMAEWNRIRKRDHDKDAHKDARNNALQLVTTLAVVVVALAAAVGGSLSRGDLGHALVAVGIAGTFAWLFGGLMLRAGLAALALGGLLLLAVIYATQRLPDWLMTAVRAVLPHHAQERFVAMVDPLSVTASDMARVRWLMDSAGASGWGAGWVPWGGFGEARLADGLPLQGPSDYVPAMLVAQWGAVPGALMLLALTALFVGAAVVAGRKAFATRASPILRFLTATGMFGCVLMAGKVLLSLGGVTGVLPLTGLPVALLGYGSASTLFALVYLALALGPQQHAEPPRPGVRFERSPQAGELVKHGRILALTAGVVMLLLTFASLTRMHAPLGREGALVCQASQPVGPMTQLTPHQTQVGASAMRNAQPHCAASAYYLTQAVVHAVQPANPVPTASASSAVAATEVCPQMTAIVDAWNDRLKELHGPHLQPIDGMALRAHMDALQVGWRNASECRHRARELGLLLQSALPKSLEAGGSPRGGPAERFKAFFVPQASKAVSMNDFQTPNVWRGLPGCIVPVAALQPGPAVRRCTAEDRSASRLEPPGAVSAVAQIGALVAKVPVESLVLDSFWTQQQLAPQLARLKTYTDETLQFEWRHHSVHAGPVAGITLDPVLQGLAQRVAECATGQRKAADECKGFWHAGAGPGKRIRAGAMGLVLAEVDSGRVVAFANAISDCSLQALGRMQPTHGQANRNVTGDHGPSSICAAWPDRTVDELALEAPALWMVPPGSSMKPLVVMAGFKHGLIRSTDNERKGWRDILKKSDDQDSIKKLAVDAAPTYRDVLREAGFDLEPKGPFRQQPSQAELLWGKYPAALGAADAAPLGTRFWKLTQHIGHRVALDEKQTVDWRLPVSLTSKQFQDMWKAKSSGVPYAAQVQRFDPAQMREYPFALHLANASIGGGDIRVSAVGLAEVWRSIDLQARHHSHKAVLHLLEAPGVSVPKIPLRLATPAAAEFAMFATSAVTAPGGTGNAACNLVFGDCRDGHRDATLHGKTGTSDFTQGDNSTLVKPGLQVPAKLFGGVFEVAGKRYAVAAVGLRVVQGQGLDGQSAAAEAALTLQREMLRIARP